MNEKKAKQLRREFREQGIPICAEPYKEINGQKYASEGRRKYQSAKKA